MEFIDALLDGDYMPHGHCLLWRTDLLVLHVGGDILTFVSYMLIPLALVRLVRARDDLKFDWLFLMFAGFIFFCGATHLLGIINVWHGYYYIHGIVKSMTGLISILTAIMLWRLLPVAINLPSKRTLQLKVAELTRAEQQLAESNQRLEAEVAKRTAQLEKMATTDELTALLNRREIMRLLEAEILRGKRQDNALSIMMLDLDHFKQINDTYGHQAGDSVLADAATTFSSLIRATDFIGRVGGEEFLIILPDTDAPAAVHLAERVRAAMDHHFNTGYGQRCTVSIGIAQSQPDDDTHSLIHRADQALYLAKTTGRNRVSLAAIKS